MYLEYATVIENLIFKVSINLTCAAKSVGTQTYCEGLSIPVPIEDTNKFSIMLNGFILLTKKQIHISVYAGIYQWGLFQLLFCILQAQTKGN